MADKRITHYIFADLVLDVQRGELTRDTINIALPKLSYDLLVALVESAPALLSQQELMQKVWPERVIGDETLKQRIKLLRKALGDDAAAPFYIEAVRGRGYRLLPKVTCNCIVPKPPSVMLDLSANDQFPSFSIHQITSFWRMLSKGGLIILFLLIISITIFSYFTSPEQYFNNSRLVILPFKHQLPESKIFVINKVNDALIRALSKSKNKQLVSPSLVANISSTGKSLDVIAKKFNAGLILNGDIYLSPDNMLSIRLQLTDVNFQALIWHGEFNSSVSELDDLQKELSKKLILALSDNQNEQVGNDRQLNELSYQHFQKAKQYYKRYRKVDNDIAIDFFYKAINADSKYSLAYSGLSQAYSQQLFQFGGNESDRIKAIDNAYQAITYDSQSAEAYKALGSAYYVSGWLSKSINANLSALELSPNNIEIITNLGFIYSEQGELAKALSFSRQALQLNSVDVVAMVHHGITLQRLAKYKQALQWFEKAISVQPDYLLATYHLGQLYIEQDKFEDAKNVYFKTLQRHENHPLLTEGLADSYLYSGELTDAKSWYKKSKSISNHSNTSIKTEMSRTSRVALLSILLKGNASEQEVSMLITIAEKAHVKGSDKAMDSYNLALLYAYRNKKEMTIRYLVQAVEQGLMSPHLIEKQPLFTKLRLMSAYSKIIDKIQDKRQKEGLISINSTYIPALLEDAGISKSRKGQVQGVD